MVLYIICKSVRQKIKQENQIGNSEGENGRFQFQFICGHGRFVWWVPLGQRPKKGSEVNQAAI